MPDFAQVTPIDSKPSAEATNRGGLSSEQELASLAWTISIGTPVGLLEPASSLVRTLEPQSAR